MNRMTIIHVKTICASITNIYKHHFTNVKADKCFYFLIHRYTCFLNLGKLQKYEHERQGFIN